MPPSPALAASRARTDAGRLFSAPFRPLFLAASLLAAAAVPAWALMFLSGTAEVAGMPALAWHAHEMVFGYLPAVMAGYLLSATPNWSGRLPVSGRPLALLVATWLAGRLLPPLAPFAVGTLADVAFPLAVAAVLLREAAVRAPRHSRHGLMLFPVIAVASLAHRLLADDPAIASAMARVGVAVAILMISAIGGRLVPSLTRNVLAARNAARVPEPYGRFDVAVLLVVSLALASWVVAPDHPLTAPAMIVAAAVQTVRLARWRGWLVREPEILALHAGYLWVVVGTALAGLAAGPLAFVPVDAALHAFTAGAIGGMTMAVMTRLSFRGPASRSAGRAALAATVLVHCGAVPRVAAPIAAAWYVPLIAWGAALWSAGFLLFALAEVAEAFAAPAPPAMAAGERGGRGPAGG